MGGKMSELFFFPFDSPWTFSLLIGFNSLINPWSGDISFTPKSLPSFNICKVYVDWSIACIFRSKTLELCLLTFVINEKVKIFHINEKSNIFNITFIYYHITCIDL